MIFLYIGIALLVLAVFIFVILPLMARNAIHPEPGVVKFVRYYASPLDSVSKKPSKRFLKEDDDYLHHYGKKLEEVSIPIEPIRVEVQEKNFRTSDNAIIQFTLIINVRPIFDKLGIDIEEIRDIQPREGEGEGEAGNVDNSIRGRIRQTIGQAISIEDSHYNCVWIYKKKEEHNTPKQKLENILKVLVDEFQNKVTFSEILHPVQYQASGREDDGDAIEKHVLSKLTKQSSSKSLFDDMEEEANRILKEWNFEVVPNTCDIDFKYNLPENEEERYSPHYAPIVQFLKYYDKVKEELKNKDILHKEAMNKTIKRDAELEKEKEINEKIVEQEAKKKLNEIEILVKEQETKKQIEEKEEDKKLKIELTKISAAEAEGTKKYIEDKVKAEESINESNIKTEKQKVKLTKEVLESREALAEKSKKFNEIPFTWKELSKLVAKRLDITIKEMEDDILKLQFKNSIRDKRVEFVSTYWNHNLNRELKLDSLKHYLLEKILSREIVLAYSELNFNEKDKLLKTLGQQITAALEKAVGVANEVKLIRTSGGGGNDPIFNLINKVTDGIFQSEAVKPLLDSALSEIGIKWDGKEGENSGNLKEQDETENALNLKIGEEKIQNFQEDKSKSNIEDHPPFEDKDDSFFGTEDIGFEEE